MKLKIIALGICLVSLFSACNEDDNESELPASGSRTVLVYMAAENSLSSFATIDLSEMIKGMERVDASMNNLLVYIDDYSTPRLIRLGKDKKGKVVEELVANYPEQNSVDVSVMKEIFSTAFNKYKAESYGIVFWSHGEGWVPYAKASTRWWGQDFVDKESKQMNIADLHEALKVAPHFDYLFFDACFMQSIEVAYELRDRGDYFISSPTEIPGPGAPYQEVVPFLFANENAAIQIADSYYHYYKGIYNDGIGITNSNWTGGVSVGVMKADELENLAAATARILPKYVQNQQAISVADLMCYDVLRKTGYYYDFNGAMYNLTDGNNDYDRWKESFDKAVIYWNTTPRNYSGYGGMFSMEGATGLSTYILRGSYNSSLNTFYRTYQWYKDAGWNQTGW